MGDLELLGHQSAVWEARALYRMLGPEHTVEELRELIAVPPKIERILRGFALEDPADSHWIEAALGFRQAVAREFERLVSGAPVMDSPEEAEEAESAAGEEALVGAEL